MIRKAIIVVLTLGAVAIAIVGWLSYSKPIHGLYSPSSQSSLIVHFEEGAIRLMVFRVDGDLLSTQVIDRPPPNPLRTGNPGASWSQVYLKAALRGAGGVACDTFVKLPPKAVLGTPRVPKTHGLVWPWRRMSCGIELAAVRTRTWTVFLVLASYPAVTFIRGSLRRYRRRRRNLCINCGYDLTGNVSGACSECGAEVTVT